MYIPFRTGIDTLLTLEAVPGKFRCRIRCQFNIRRTFHGTCTAASDTLGTVSAQGKQRQYRKHGKYRSHRAQHTTEKAFLKRHTNQDQHQKHQPYDIAAQFEITGMQHGKYIPWAHALCLAVHTGITTYYQKHQHDIFHCLQIFYHRCFHRHRFLFQFLADKHIKCAHCIPKTSKGTGKPAEKSAEYNRKQAESDQCNHKGSQLQVTLCPHLGKNVFYTVKSGCIGRRNKQKIQ